MLGLFGFGIVLVGVVVLAIGGGAAGLLLCAAGLALIIADDS